MLDHTVSSIRSWDTLEKSTCIIHFNNVTTNQRWKKLLAVAGSSANIVNDTIVSQRIQTPLRARNTHCSMRRSRASDLICTWAFKVDSIKFKFTTLMWIYTAFNVDEMSRIDNKTTCIYETTSSKFGSCVVCAPYNFSMTRSVKSLRACTSRALFQSTCKNPQSKSMWEHMHQTVRRFLFALL